MPLPGNNSVSHPLITCVRDLQLNVRPRESPMVKKHSIGVAIITKKSMVKTRIGIHDHEYQIFDLAIFIL